MKYAIVGKNMEVTPALDTAIREKLGRLDKFFKVDTEVRVVLQVNKDRQTIEVTIPIRDGVIRTEQTSNDMYVSLDLAAEVLERQLKKYKNKLIDKHQTGSFRQEYLDRDYDDEGTVHIVRKKQFDMKPMYPEDACVQMELLGHDFYVFCNAETEQINVVYKRKGNTYGLIEPDV